MQRLRICRNRHIVAHGHRSISSIVFNPVFNSSIHSRCALPRKNCLRGGAVLCSENLLRISIFQETVSCPNCQLQQYERSSGKCRRCHDPLGISYIEIYLPSSLAPVTSQIRKEVGGLIRRLRSRREITQASLAALTGIHRTYLSRAEHGQVMPSIIALMQMPASWKSTRYCCAFAVHPIDSRQPGMCRLRHIPDGRRSCARLNP